MRLCGVCVRMIRGGSSLTCHSLTRLIGITKTRTANREEEEKNCLAHLVLGLVFGSFPITLFSGIHRLPLDSAIHAHDVELYE